MKKKVIIVIAIVNIIAISFATLLYTGVIKLDKPQVEETINNEVIKEEEKINPYKQVWKDNHNINSDYVGELVFDSKLVEKSFVQAKDVYDSSGKPYTFYTQFGDVVNNVDEYDGNSVYIWMNWKDGTYDYNIEGGSVFMDYRNYLNDQNIIIYGHHFSEAGGNDRERNKSFTPLEKLLKKENYEDNKTLKLYLEDEIRSYELAGVYIYDVYDEYCENNLQYYRTEYNYDEFEDILDDEYYAKYIDAFEKHKLYDTGLSLNTDDKTLTLQTCISGKDGIEYEICVFKLINTEEYEDD